MNWPLLQNSLFVAGLTTLGAVAIGVIAAVGLAALEPRWRNPLLLTAVLALILPPFLVTNCWLHYLGLTGVWRSWLPLNIYSLGGTVWILILLTWPLPLLAALSAWQRLEPSQFESDPAVRGAALVRWLLWPAARATAAQAAVLTFVLALNQFAVPAILQVKVFPAQLWVKFETNRDFAAALALSWPLLLAPLLLLLCLRRSEVRWPRVEGSAPAGALRRHLGAGWFGLGATVTVLMIALSIGLPLAQLVTSGRTWTELPNLLRAVPAAIWNSFELAAVTASICVVLGLVSWRWPIGLALWLPLLVPGVFLGIIMIFVFNRPGLQVVGQSAAVVLLAYTIRYMAPAWNGVAHALRTVDHDLTDAARLDGASGWSLLRHVQWPQIAPALGVSWYVTYLLCLWDVEALVLIVPPGGETLALRIFNLLHYGHNAQVNALCLVLLMVAAAPLAAWMIWQWIRAAR
jgi:iron(III) transport system permease protein